MAGKIRWVFIALLLGAYSLAQTGTTVKSSWTDKNDTEEYAAHMLQLAYNERGYWGAKINMTQAGGKRIFTVNPGQLYLVSDIIVSGVKGISVDDMMVDAPKPGDVYSPARFNEWIAAVNKKYAGNSGPLKSAKWGARMDHARPRVTIQATFEVRIPIASPQ
jgi:outer membrane protein assembly factor BamA